MSIKSESNRKKVIEQKIKGDGVTMCNIAHGQCKFLKIDQRAHENIEVDMLKNTHKK